MLDATPYRRAMLARLAELGLRLHDIEAELDEPHSKDWEDRATEREGDEVLEQLGQSGQTEIMRIRAALKRIREDTYGLCVRCENPVSEERLAVLPETPLCRTCAARG